MGELSKTVKYILLLSTLVVFTSGCDIPPASKWENIDAYFAAVDEYYDKR